MHGSMTGRMLDEIEKVLVKEKPNLVLVYGDTNSTLAGALAAIKLHIPVAHIEAGLRSHNINMPEEVNRILTDRISRCLFAPSKIACKNLQKEGFKKENIIFTGDVMYDLALLQGKHIKSSEGLLSALRIPPKDYILITIHRAENTDSFSRMNSIIDALNAISKNMVIVWPLHPRTKAVLKKLELLEKIDSKIKIIEPVGYLDMLQLEKFAAVIATDSGGVQKEAFFYKVPCVTLREETEWVELIDAGWNRLACTNDSNKIVTAIKDAIGSKGINVKPYGDGYAAKKIIQGIIEIN